MKLEYLRGFVFTFRKRQSVKVRAVQPGSVQFESRPFQLFLHLKGQRHKTPLTTFIGACFYFLKTITFATYWLELNNAFSFDQNGNFKNFYKKSLIDINLNIKLKGKSYYLVHLRGDATELNLILHHFLPYLGDILTQLVEF